MAEKIVIGRQLGRWIGQVTAIAGNFTAPDGTTWRDSKPADRRVQATNRRQRQDRQTTAAAAPTVPPQQRWASAVLASAITETSLRHDTHRMVITGSITWCDRCGAYAETRGRGMARPCRGPVAGGNRVGRPLKDVQARLRALRAGRHPTTGVELTPVIPVCPRPSSRDGPRRERSRSQRRADGCRRLIAAIGGGELAPLPVAESAASTEAGVRQRCGLSSAPADRRAAMCRLLIAAAGEGGASPPGTPCEPQTARQ